VSRPRPLANCEQITNQHWLQCRRSCGSDYQGFVEISHRNDFPESFHLSRSWLTTCRETQLQSPSSYMPSHPLDLGAHQPKLVLRAEIPSRSPFAALSYCWGSNIPLITTLSNIKQHREGISLETFPLTVRDGIKIARLLGFRYIWVDSICIIQDSKRDWHEESSHMDKIYGEVDVVIAAYGATAAVDGLLRERLLLPQGTVSVSINGAISLVLFKCCGYMDTRVATQSRLEHRHSQKDYWLNDTSPMIMKIRDENAVHARHASAIGRLQDYIALSRFRTSVQCWKKPTVGHG